MDEIVKAEGYAGLMPRKKNAAEPKRSPPPPPDELEALKKRGEELEISNAILKETIEIIKKGPRVDPKDLSHGEKTRVVDALKNRYSPHILQVYRRLPRSSYYYHSKRQKQIQRKEIFRIKIREIFQNSRQTYGYRRIWQILQNDGWILSETVIRPIMREERLQIVKKRRRR
ncbi:MAG: IS3 family transposase [Oscillospiraceae bacterium]|nr:IS3 family transposase [Oscillospiraceae bacterium]